MNFNEDGNILGRILALALLIVAVVGVRRLTCGGQCPLGAEGCAFHATRGPSSSAPNTDDVPR